ncbi:MAG: oxygenase MpaB family protein [Christiangramia sp.]|nr:oxygenase MpaB family protein [Christiangramia sp.]
MEKEYFVAKDSIVREIWGKSDTILFIFAGASAEFALNKAVDWLYFTGKLPKDPLGRLFSTVSYAREIVFADKQSAINAIERINQIHSSVENKRGKKIPDWAYRNVLFMLIDYSVRSFEILERPLRIEEKEEVFKVFREVGCRMGIKDLPKDFSHYEIMREQHLEQHLYSGKYTEDLYSQYRKHLGFIRYNLLIETQKLITPETVRKMLGLNGLSLLKPLIIMYKFSRSFHLDKLLKSLLLPPDYKDEIRSLDRITT